MSHPDQSPHQPGAPTPGNDSPFHRSYDDLRRGARTWLILQGVLGIIMGLLFLFMPGVTVVVFAIMFAIWLVVGGVFSLLSHFSRAKEHRSGWVLAGAILSIIAGIVALFMPGAATLALALLIGFWALLAGISAIAGSFNLKKMGAKYWWALLISGILCVLVGLLFAVTPGTALVSLVWVVGIFAIVDGITEIILGIRMKKPSTT